MEELREIKEEIREIKEELERLREKVDSLDDAATPYKKIGVEPDTWIPDMPVVELDDWEWERCEYCGTLIEKGKGCTMRRCPGFMKKRDGKKKGRRGR